MPRFKKRVVLALSDLLLLGFALWAAVSIRHSEFFVPKSALSALLLAAGPVIIVVVFAYFKLYRIVTRFLGYRGTLRIVSCVGLGILFWSLLVFMAGQQGVPRSAIIPFWLIGSLLVVMSRQIAGIVLRSVGIRLPHFSREDERKNVVIYGAGHLGVELLHALRRARDREPVAFIDQSPTLRGQYVDELRVYHPEKLASIIERSDVKEVLVALPGSMRRERRQVLQQLEQYPVEVKILPAYEDLASGRVGVNDLRPVDVGDLLGRDPVQPSPELLARANKDKAILVTGAGGSIGSELVRQIVRQHPSRIVLLDVSEAALYEIDMEVTEWAAKQPEGQPRPEVVGLIGSVLDKGLVEDVLRRYRIDTIYHAAAYKHVPIVEQNPVIGISNNVFGTLVLAEAAREAGVERVVFISTDKAVRPTNVMGASKRLAELVLQAEAAECPTTVFTMVRFGNVLDSSGSVVRRFRKQIKSGGPVTVTHPEIERYFMSIPEAAELVLQAGAMAKGGEVFVLHMGDPVKIDKLARLMIHLSGLEVRDDQNPDGDITIVYTGLRPGEKLYEELLIGAHTTGTEHPRILKSDEPYLPRADLERELSVLTDAMTSRDVAAIEAVLLRTVEGYNPRGDRALGETVSPAAWVAPTRTLH